MRMQNRIPRFFKGFIDLPIANERFGMNRCWIYSSIRDTAIIGKKFYQYW